MNARYPPYFYRRTSGASMHESDPYARLDQAADSIQRRMAYEMANRRGLLWIHAFVGLTAGPQMLLWGSATSIEGSVGVWTRLPMALLGLVGGAFLVAGLSSRPRNPRLEGLGLVTLAAWDLAMMLGLMWARIEQADFDPRPLGEPLPIGYVVAYPVAIYAGYLALLAAHLVTLYRLRSKQ